MEECQLHGSIRGYAGARGQTQAGATLHGGRMTAGETLRCSPNASPAVAPSLLHRRPHSGALGPPGRPEASEFVGERQGATLAFARRRRGRSAGGCSGVLSSGGRGGHGGGHAAVA